MISRSILNTSVSMSVTTVTIVTIVTIACCIAIFSNKRNIPLLGLFNQDAGFHLEQHLAYRAIEFTQGQGDLLWFHGPVILMQQIDNGPPRARARTWSTNGGIFS